MDREREHSRIISKNSRGPVALMHVRIDNNRFFDRTICLQAANRNRDIMNRAKPFAVARIRMVEYAAEISTEPVATRQLAGEERSSGSKPQRINELGRV